MRKLKLQMQMTINGYVGGPNGENDWMTWNPDPEFTAFLCSMLDTSDTLLLGRKLADSFIQYWEHTAKENPAFMDSWVDIVGYFGSFLSAITFFPQVYKAWKTKSVGDLSLTMILIVFTSTLVWIVYGVAKGIGPVILCNAIMSVLVASLIYFKFTFKS